MIRTALGKSAVADTELITFGSNVNKGEDPVGEAGLECLLQSSDLIFLK
jgi:hypothetical protein